MFLLVGGSVVGVWGWGRDNHPPSQARAPARPIHVPHPPPDPDDLTYAVVGSRSSSRRPSAHPPAQQLDGLGVVRVDSDGPGVVGFQDQQAG